MTMHAELLSKTDNTVRTIEVRIGLTGAPIRHYCGRHTFQPHTLRVTYTKFAAESWMVTTASVYGPTILKGGKFGTREITEDLITHNGTISVSTAVDPDNDPFVASPALAAIVIEHLPKDE